MAHPALHEMNPLNAYQDKRILITGGTGYLGSAILAKLCQVPCQITVIARQNQNAYEGVSQKAQVIFKNLDVKKKQTWKEAVLHTDIIFHLAAQTSTYVANQNPMADFESNVLPLLYFIESCQESNVRPDIIFSGTATQAGLTPSNPVDESFPDEPVTIYDIHKLLAEKYLQYYGRQLEGRSVTLRLANVYGPGHQSGAHDRGILNQMVKKSLHGERLTVYGTGEFMRDYIFIDEVVDAFLLAGQKIDLLNGRYFFIGSGTGNTVREMAKMVQSEASKKLGKNIEIQFVDPPQDLSPIEFRNFIANPKAFMKATGWRPKISLQEGICRTLNFYAQTVKKI